MSLTTQAFAILSFPGRCRTEPLKAFAYMLMLADPEPPPEELDPKSVRQLFDLVAERAMDRATAGGFVRLVELFDLVVPEAVQNLERPVWA